MSARILYVDDNPETGRAALSDLELCELNTVSDIDLLKSSGIITDQLKGIDIVLMDYELHERSDGGDPNEPALDGLELLERFRAAIRQSEAGGNHPPVLAIYTAKFTELANVFDCVPVAPIVARAAKVDWVFKKGSMNNGAEGNLTDRINELLDGYERVQIKWSNDVAAVEESLKRLMNLPEKGKAVWSSGAFEQFRDARPPIQTLQHRNGGVTLLRWLLQVALPFPSCFVDDAWVAVKLGVELNSLRKGLDSVPDSELAVELNARAYTGLLMEFLGRRYWRAGVDELAWSISEGRSSRKPAVREKLRQMAGCMLDFLEFETPVLVISPDDYMQHGNVAELDDAVQIQTDYWPPGVEPPWVWKDDAKDDSEISALVINKDKDRIPAE